MNLAATLLSLFRTRSKTRSDSQSSTDASFLDQDMKTTIGKSSNLAGNSPFEHILSRIYGQANVTDKARRSVRRLPYSKLSL